MKTKYNIGDTYKVGETTWTIVAIEPTRSGIYGNYIIRREEIMEPTEMNYHMGFITKAMLNGEEPSICITEEKHSTFHPKYKDLWDRVR